MNIDWKKEGEKLIEKLLNTIDYFCQNISGDPLIDCYIAHMRDLYEVADEFTGWSKYNITKDDLQLLEEMPDEIYYKLQTKFEQEIEKIVEKIRKEFSAYTEVI